MSVVNRAATVTLTWTYSLIKALCFISVTSYLFWISDIRKIYSYQYWAKKKKKKVILQRLPDFMKSSKVILENEYNHMQSHKKMKMIGELA